MSETRIIHTVNVQSELEPDPKPKPFFFVTPQFVVQATGTFTLPEAKSEHKSEQGESS